MVVAIIPAPTTHRYYLDWTSGCEKKSICDATKSFLFLTQRMLALLILSPPSNLDSLTHSLARPLFLSLPDSRGKKVLREEEKKESHMCTLSLFALTRTPVRNTYIRGNTHVRGIQEYIYQLV